MSTPFIAHALSSPFRGIPPYTDAQQVQCHTRIGVATATRKVLTRYFLLRLRVEMPHSLTTPREGRTKFMKGW